MQMQCPVLISTEQSEEEEEDEGQPGIYRNFFNDTTGLAFVPPPQQSPGASKYDLVNHLKRSKANA